MTIKVGDKLPSVTLRYVTPDGVKAVTTDEFFGSDFRAPIRGPAPSAICLVMSRMRPSSRPRGSIRSPAFPPTTTL